MTDSFQNESARGSSTVAARPRGAARDRRRGRAAERVVSRRHDRGPPL